MPFRLNAGAESLKLPRTNLVENGLGHDRACRISGAEKKHIERVVTHGSPHMHFCETARRAVFPVFGLQSSGRP